MCVGQTMRTEGKKPAMAQMMIGMGRYMSAQSQGKPVSREMFQRGYMKTAAPLGGTSAPLGG